MHPLVALTTGQAQVVSAIALIIVSGLAAWSAYGAFLEARRTREQAARPSLALDLVSVTNLYVEVAIVNVGQGAALDADLELAFVPEEGDPVRRRWIWPLVAPGQRYQFGPPEVGGQKRPDLGAWAAVYPNVSLAGIVRDQLGNEHRVELNMTDVFGLRELAMQAGLAGLRETSEQRNLKSLAKSAKAVSAAVERVASAQEKRAE